MRSSKEVNLLLPLIARLGLVNAMVDHYICAGALIPPLTPLECSLIYDMLRPSKHLAPMRFLTIDVTNL